uniref:SAP domain-containing protein n=2 Tax=Lotharella globosa TaxID=91324 RepID=A0A7S4DPI5_9EUKA
MSPLEAWVLVLLVIGSIEGNVKSSDGSVSGDAGASSLSSKSVRELKSMLKELKGDSKGVLEKSDLVQRVMEAQKTCSYKVKSSSTKDEGKDSKPSSSSSSSSSS